MFVLRGKPQNIPSNTARICLTISPPIALLMFVIALRKPAIADVAQFGTGAGVI